LHLTFFDVPWEFTCSPYIVVWYDDVAHDQDVKPLFVTFFCKWEVTNHIRVNMKVNIQNLLNYRINLCTR